MLEKFTHFLKYNNAVPLTVSFLLLSFSGVLAASPEVRGIMGEAILSETQTVKSVDNSYIVGKDLASYVPTIQITGVEEDSDSYYVSYNFTTIDIEEYVWKDVVKKVVLKVAKAALSGSDLGLYVTRQLKEVIDGELVYLSRVQAIERPRGLQDKVVATVYSGLVGKFLDPKEDVIPGYEPVIKPLPPEEPREIVQNNSTGEQSGQGTNTIENKSNESQGENGSPQPSSQRGQTTVTLAGNSEDAEAPKLYVLGKSPAQIPVGATYSDLGVVVTDNVNQNLGYHSLGLEEIDTSKPGEFTVTYVAADQVGNTTRTTRILIVYDPTKGPPYDPDTIPTVSVPPEEPKVEPAESPAPSEQEEISTPIEPPIAPPIEIPPVDTIPPTVSLIGSAEITIEHSKAYTDEGATAVDDMDGDISTRIIVSGAVDTSIVGIYILTFTAEDIAGNEGQATRTVTVVLPAEAQNTVPEVPTTPETPTESETP